MKAETERRREALAVLATATAADLTRLWYASELPGDAELLRGPETGLVALKGRIGGSGAPFNFGEATVTRVSVRIATGETGHAYALGRDGEKVRLAATIDALFQRTEHAEAIEASILQPLREAAAERDARRRAETAATKVDLFTMGAGRGLMPVNGTAVSGGFANPVFDAQSVFRLVMDAMARPGTCRSCGDLAATPAPLTPHAGVLALALCDHDTPVWLDPALARSGEVAEWFAFHTGAPITQVPAEAHFAFVAEPAQFIGLDNFAQGRQDYPDRSTTLILQVETLDAGTPLLLTGLGIRGRETLAPAPLPRRFLEQWAESNARFPRGVDVILAGPGGFAALPRTTRITAKEDAACM